MTQKAIDLLSGSDKGKDKGFFLQVESASIDKRTTPPIRAARSARPSNSTRRCRRRSSSRRRTATPWCIATADHGHTSQIVENVTEDDLQGIAEDAKLPIERVRDIVYPGLTRMLTTADDAEMTVSYGTSADVAVEDQTHTGTQVRIAAFGPRAANIVALTDQSDLFFTMTDALGINRS